jgi:hypothetical protein
VSLRAILVFTIVVLARAGAGSACVGDGCVQIYASDGGQLATSWDFARHVQTFEVLCAGGTCLYSSIDPGFLNGFAPTPPGLLPLAAGTKVRFETVAADSGVRFQLNGVTLGPGMSGLIGTAPDLHTHPSWQLSLPRGERGDYALSFRLTTDSVLYDDSPVYTMILTNLEPSTATPAAPTATPTPTATLAQLECRGDCDGNGVVAVNELIRGVGDALQQTHNCPAMDFDASGAVSVSELIAAVRSALAGCFSPATPTPTLPATLAAIQSEIFSPRCAIPTCHDSAAKSGNLVLEAGASYAALVGVEPDVDTARMAGLLRVDPAVPDNSFLLVKLVGPPLSQGSRMPLVGRLLSDGEVAVIRAWIAAGALPSTASRVAGGPVRWRKTPAPLVPVSVVSSD